MGKRIRHHYGLRYRACATLTAAVLNKKSVRKNIVRMDGGDLTIEWNEKDEHIYMTGEAAITFEGKIKI